MSDDVVWLRPVTTPIQVRFSDTDMMGHISSMSYAAYAEVGRARFFEQLEAERSEIPWFVLVRVALDFRRETVFGQEVVLETRAARIGTKSLTLHQEVHRDGELACSLEVVMSAFDPKTRGSIEVPKTWRIPE